MVWSTLGDDIRFVHEKTVKVSVLGRSGGCFLEAAWANCNLLHSRKVEYNLQSVLAIDNGNDRNIRAVRERDPSPNAGAKFEVSGVIFFVPSKTEPQKICESSSGKSGDRALICPIFLISHWTVLIWPCSSFRFATVRVLTIFRFWCRDVKIEDAKNWSLSGLMLTCGWVEVWPRMMCKNWALR